MRPQTLQKQLQESGLNLSRTLPWFLIGYRDPFGATVPPCTQFRRFKNIEVFTVENSANISVHPQARKPNSGLGIYYTHERVNDNANPLFRVAEPFDRKGLLYDDDAVGTGVKPYQLAIAAPKPRKPVFVDYHSASFPIISDKIKQAIEPMVWGSIEFVPARLDDGKLSRPFWIMHSLCSHDVLDTERSEFTTLPSGGISWIDKLVINEQKLAQIAIEKRRLFLLRETATTYLWHEDVVAAVQRSQAAGIRFFPAQGYDQDTMFER
jgi:hypothetical protein